MFVHAQPNVCEHALDLRTPFIGSELLACSTSTPYSSIKEHIAADVNEAQPHTASMTIAEMLDLLKEENAHARFEYYKRAVRTEHLHDFHYPDPLGPPNPTQPCARLLKGTMNMWYCGNGYPMDLVCETCEQSVAQDALPPDLWRVNLCRNCPIVNPPSIINPQFVCTHPVGVISEFHSPLIPRTPCSLDVNSSS